MTAFMTILLLLTTMAAAPSEEALWEAARDGDLESVQRLLEQGADVNAKTRYGATALLFAADRGHLEVARYLLSKGAKVDATDTFYEAAPMTWALSNGHFDLAKLLIEAGSEMVLGPMSFAIRAGNDDLLEAALASPHADQNALGQALETAQRMGRTAMVERLLKAGAKEPLPPEVVELEEAVLQRYVGTYRDEDSGAVSQVKLEGGRLRIQLSDSEPVDLEALGQTSFQAVGDPESQVFFSGRGGMVERVVIQMGGDRQVLPRWDDPLTVASASDRPVQSAQEEVGGEWSSFRGPNGRGVGDGSGVPVEWDIESGKNVIWKRPIPGITNSSPVIWGDHVFLTTSISSSGDNSFRPGLYGDVKPVDDLSEHEWKAYSIHRKTGEIQWEKTIHRGVPAVRRHTKASQSNSTPATNGRHLVVLLGSVGKLVNYDMAGNLLWEKQIGVLDSGWFYNPDYQWGHASSPVIYEDRVIVQADIQGQSYLAAFRLQDGELLWKTAREEIPTWGTPAIHRGEDRDEVVTNGTRIRAYDPATGRELWSLGPNSEVVVATPVVGANLIYFTAGYPPVRPIYAVRPGGSGDLSLAEDVNSSEWIKWSKRRGGTYIPTPLLYRGYLYTNANNGRLVCYDAQTGAELYRARIGGSGGSYLASPVAADGRIYFSSETGDIHVIKAGPKYEEVAHNSMDEIIAATPALSKGVLIVRTLGHLYGIGESDQQ